MAHSDAVGCRQRLTGTHLVVDVGIRACMAAQQQPATKVGGLPIQWLHAPRGMQMNKTVLTEVVCKVLAVGSPSVQPRPTHAVLPGVVCCLAANVLRVAGGPARATRVGKCCDVCLLQAGVPAAAATAVLICCCCCCGFAGCQATGSAETTGMYDGFPIEVTGQAAKAVSAAAGSFVPDHVYRCQGGWVKG